MLISEKIAYLNGLFDGLEIDATTKEGKMLKGILDALAEIAQSIEDLESDVVDLNQGLEDTFDDIDEIYGELDGVSDFEDYDDDCDEFENEFGGGFEELFEEHDIDARSKFENELGTDCLLTDDLETINSDLYEVACPTCGEVIFFDEDTLDKGSMNCHACGEELEFDTSELEKEEE